VTDWVAIGRLDGFREGRGRVVVVGGVRIAVFRVGERLFAMRDACPHMGLSLADASPQEGTVTCHGHGWKFDLVTGRSDRRSGACAAIYAVRIDGGDVFVRPPLREAEPAVSDEEWVAWDDERHGPKRGSVASDRAPNGEVGGGEADEDTDR